MSKELKAIAGRVSGLKRVSLKKRIAERTAAIKARYKALVSNPPTEAELRQAIIDAEIALGAQFENLEDARDVYDAALDDFDTAIDSENQVQIAAAAKAVNAAVRDLTVAERLYDQKEIALLAAQAILEFFLTDQ